jgi:hypothetical protein
VPEIPILPFSPNDKAANFSFSSGVNKVPSTYEVLPSSLTTV